ncbi:MAG: sugar nucleotide-binding protein [Chitinivibrionales bacterium]|nr:sugar nucleotide-binding protein [Chitinivibrionales bacterium]
MKILLTGASGLLGRAIYNELTTHSGDRVIGTAFSRAQAPLVKLNLRDRKAVEQLIGEEKPDLIIHSAAERHPDICRKDPEGTLRLNVEVTRWIAEFAKETGSLLLYISTDYVFDGTAPPYHPEDTPNPVNLYGKSKLEGERCIQSILEDYLILRVPILYGPIESLDESPVTIIARQLMKENVRTFDNWANRYPTLTTDIAVVIRQMIEQRKSGNSAVRGICHWSGGEALTKYAMALIIADIIGTAPDSVEPVNDPPPGAPRPQNPHIDSSKLEKHGIGQRSGFRKSMREIITPFQRQFS